MKQLLVNQSADIATPTAIADSNYMESVGAGSNLFHMIGAYDGCSVKVYLSSDTFNDGVILNELIFTVSSDRIVIMTIPAGVGIMAVLEGAGDNTDLTLNVVGPGL